MDALLKPSGPQERTKGWPGGAQSIVKMFMIIRLHHQLINGSSALINGIHTEVVKSPNLRESLIWFKLNLWQYLDFSIMFSMRCQCCYTPLPTRHQWNGENMTWWSSEIKAICPLHRHTNALWTQSHLCLRCFQGCRWKNLPGVIFPSVIRSNCSECHTHAWAVIVFLCHLCHW